MENEKHSGNVFAAIRDAVAQGDNIQNEVHDIVVQAFSSIKMQPEKIPEVLKETVEGAVDGSLKFSGLESDALKQAMHGVDDALSQAAEASKLALEEAAGNVKAYSENDLQRAFEDFKTLETLFIDTLGKVAESSSSKANEVLNDLLAHSRTNGTAVGKTIAEVMEGLRRLLADSSAHYQTQASDTVQVVGETVAGLASGILSGIAKNLEKKDAS